MHSAARRTHRIAAPAAVALLLLGLVACAPEDTVVAGQGGKDGSPTQSESSWAEPEDDVSAERRQTELPAGFPSGEFVLPESAVIYDAGEREDGSWFVVLSADDAAEATGLWDEVIASGGFSVSDAASTSEGGESATLTNATLAVLALTMPQSDGSVLLSYDLRRIG